MLLTTWVESVPELIIIDPLKTSPYMIGTGTPLFETFWIPVKLKEPLILGSVSPTEETLFVGKSGVNKSLARVKAAVVRKDLLHLLQKQSLKE